MLAGSWEPQPENLNPRPKKQEQKYKCKDWSPRGSEVWVANQTPKAKSDPKPRAAGMAGRPNTRDKIQPKSKGLRYETARQNQGPALLQGLFNPRFGEGGHDGVAGG